jgi:hypothetical protein
MVRAAIQKDCSSLNLAKMFVAEKDLRPQLELVDQAEVSFEVIRMTLVQDLWFRRLQRVKVRSQSKLLLVFIQTGCRLNIS